MPPRPDRKLKKKKPRSSRPRLGDLFVTEIVGMRYQFRTERNHEQYFWKLLPGQEVRIEREPLNRKDPHACAVYLKRRRIGYLPAFVAREVSRAISKGAQFRFVIFDLSDYYHCYEGLPSTSLLGVRMDKFFPRVKTRSAK